MRAFVLMSALLAVASAKPEAGYNYPIQKHIYVHVPPPEPEEFRPQRPIATAAPQKHYKIIFIKAPSAPTPTAPIIPVQPQNEEKTLVYVLVKKPEDAPEISIPTPAPTQPSKPEVYFIRYKTQVWNIEAS
ncbi:TweedleE [Carabus blaptoides fortunei]